MSASTWPRSWLKSQIATPAVTCQTSFGASSTATSADTLVPDSVFFEDAGGEVKFQALAPPTLGDLDKLARRIIPRLLRELAADSDLSDQSDWLHLLAQSLQTGSDPPITDPPRGLCVAVRFCAAQD